MTKDANRGRRASRPQLPQSVKRFQQLLKRIELAAAYQVSPDFLLDDTDDD